MPTKAEQRKAERRLPAAKRKYGLALRKFSKDSVFTYCETFYEYKPRKDSLEITTFFKVNGDPEKYRFDYEILLEERLPRVDVIRDALWWSFVDYRKGLGGDIRAATAIPIRTAYGTLVFTPNPPPATA